MARARAQQTLPAEGMQRPSNPEVEEAAEDYRLIRDERMEMAVKEREAKRLLIQKMESHQVTTYAYLDQDSVERKVQLESKKNAKVSKAKKVDPDEDIDASDVNVQ